MIQGHQYSGSESSPETISDYNRALKMNTDRYDHIPKIHWNINLFPSGEIVGSI